MHGKAGDVSAEYCTSARSKCRRCGQGIAPEVLRIALWVQSHEFDGVIQTWYHADCFHLKYLAPKHKGTLPKALKSSSSVLGISNLRWEDQVKIGSFLGEDEFGFGGKLK